MPTYEYVCRQCGHRFEAWQHMTDDPLTVCPKCSGSIRRVLYPAGIVFKGSGFYKTEYGSSGAAASASPAESKSETGESKSASETGKSEKTGGSSSGKSEGTSSSSSPAAAAAD
jgi:putative FmdB family regulatory protein